MAQAAAEIIQEYHQHMNGEKLGEMLDKCDKASVQLPSEVILEEIDPRHLALPFPPEAILPAMRLVFATMKNQVRFALSDHQVNSIFTGVSILLPSNNRRGLHQSSPQPTQTGHKSKPTNLHLRSTSRNSIPT